MLAGYISPWWVSESSIEYDPANLPLRFGKNLLQVWDYFIVGILGNYFNLGKHDWSGLDTLSCTITFVILALTMKLLVFGYLAGDQVGFSAAGASLVFLGWFGWLGSAFSCMGMLCSK